ncbi:MAG TPA: deoxyribonuclease IV [Candidatus Andersenbacteria bacterium]|nr:deoxyribonuclease IV [Candidatus Andersenbacteria bacterium]
MPHSQKIGLHVSAAGGLSNAPENAKEFGAECFQFFSRSPRGGGAPVITDEQADLFRSRSKEYGMESYIHTPYYINFASKNNKIWHGSINAVREELMRGTQLGVKYVVTHLGSAKDHVTDKKSSEVPKEAISHAIDGLKKIFETDKEMTTKLLLEISAGAGAVLGDSFEELAVLLEGIGRKDVHVCLDTCHMFASNYDIRTEEAIDETMKHFDKALGKNQLKLVHFNDSKTELNSHKDRHEHIGMGEIGAKGLAAFMKHVDVANVNFILETQHDEYIQQDLDFLKKHRI